jgi:hypothetical protein
MAPLVNFSGVGVLAREAAKGGKECRKAGG